MNTRKPIRFRGAKFSVFVHVGYRYVWNLFIYLLRHACVTLLISRAYVVGLFADQNPDKCAERGLVRAVTNDESGQAEFALSAGFGLCSVLTIFQHWGPHLIR